MLSKQVFPWCCLVFRSSILPMLSRQVITRVIKASVHRVSLWRSPVLSRQVIARVIKASVPVVLSSVS